MEGSIKELSQYRFQRACEDYETAQLLLKSKNLKASVNRSYYAIFHALRSVTALDQFDSSKHSGIIAYINRNYVKEGIFDKGFSKMLDSAYRLREKSDYEDFMIISIEMATEQLKKAEMILNIVRNHLEKRME